MTSSLVHTPMGKTLPLANSSREFFYSTLQILGASLLIALCAQISIPLYFTPVPLSGQTFAVMLIGVTLGSRKGFLSVLAYLTEGILGLPIFCGGHFGLLYLLGPTGGYAIGFAFQAYFAGWLIEKQASYQSVKTVAALLFSCSIQMGLGALWLSLHVGLGNALMMGVYPFVFGETIKALGVAAFLKKQQGLFSNSR